jgi:hypothetical protein
MTGLFSQPSFVLSSPLPLLRDLTSADSHLRVRNYYFDRTTSLPMEQTHLGCQSYHFRAGFEVDPLEYHRVRRSH